MRKKLLLLSCSVSVACVSVYAITPPTAAPFDVQAPAYRPINNATNYEEISQAIRDAISKDIRVTGYSKSIIVVTTANGVVTLTGTVNTLQERNVIEAKAKAVSGVNKIVNKIEVLSDFKY